jgi:hypothetical protein
MGKITLSKVKGMHRQKSLNILFDGEVVGYINYSIKEHYTKERVLKLLYGNRHVAQLFRPVPNDFQFTYLYLHELHVEESMTGQGIATKALKLWRKMLPKTSMIMLEVYPFDYTSRKRLVSFYKRNDFDVFTYREYDGRRSTVALTFL